MSLVINNLTFRYKNSHVNVLDNFSAEFRYGEITAVTGENGSGKTTLAGAIMGILKPQNGWVTVDGTDISDMSLAERGRLIGYVMQNPAKQIFSETVEAEVRYGLENLQLTEEEIKNRTEYYMKYFDIEKHRNDFPFSLSHGEKQRLTLAAVLAMKPPYLILDEPTAGLDYRRKKSLGRLLCGMTDRCGIIVISHDEPFVAEYCSSGIRMEGGSERT